MNFFVCHQHALGTDETRSARREIQHVALPEQTFRTVFIENDATVDFARDLERDAAGNIRFNHTRDNVRTRRLGGNDDVNAGRTRHLRNARDRASQRPQAPFASDRQVHR